MSAKFPRQGRLFWWGPGNPGDKKTLPASHPELLARFVKEGSTSKAELFPDIDTLDVTARNEPLRVRGEPQMALWERVRRAGHVYHPLRVSTSDSVHCGMRVLRGTAERCGDSPLSCS